MKLTREKLAYLYIFKNMSDREIGIELGVTRSAITHARRRLKIPTKIGLGRKGEIVVLNELSEILGSHLVEDMNLIDGTTSFDILLDDSIRVEVKSSNLDSRGCFNFGLSNPNNSGIKHTSDVWVSNSGRTTKKLFKTCEYVALVAFNKDESNIAFIESSDPIIYEKTSFRIRKEKFEKLAINNPIEKAHIAVRTKKIV